MKYTVSIYLDDKMVRQSGHSTYWGEYSTVEPADAARAYLSNTQGVAGKMLMNNPNIDAIICVTTPDADYGKYKVWLFEPIGEGDVRPLSMWDA